MPFCPVKSLLQYCNSRGALPRPLFCQQNLASITVYQFNTELSRCLQFCALDTSRFKGHSFRIGLRLMMVSRMRKIHTLGRWKHDAFKMQTEFKMQTDKKNCFFALETRMEITFDIISYLLSRNNLTMSSPIK